MLKIKFILGLLFLVMVWSSVNSQPISCQTITNVTSDDNLALYSVTGGPGFVSGHSPGGYPAVAEKFSNSFNITVNEVGIAFGYAVGNPSASIQVVVWNDSGNPGYFGNPGKPGSILASQQVSLSKIMQDVADTNVTWVSFNNPPSVTGDYFVGIFLTYAPGDTVGIITNSIGETIPATAWTSVDNLIQGEWVRNDSFWSAGGVPLSISHLIFSERCIECLTFTTTQSAAGNTSCANPDGTMSVNSSGAYPPYTYTIEGQSNDNGEFDNLEGGEYIVYVEDDVGCMDTVNVIVDDLTIDPVLAILGTQHNSRCVSPYNGSITVSLSDGTAPFYLEISGPDNFLLNQTYQSAFSTENFNELENGSYTISIYDENGCLAIDSVTINDEISDLSMSLTGNHETTLGAHDGSAHAAITGGTAPYNFQWSNGSSAELQEDLAPGLYSVTVTDANGCTIDGSFEILEGELTSVQTLNFIDALSIYPNPSAGLFTVNAELQNAEVLQIKVLNLLGEKTFEISTSADRIINQEINLSDQPAGMYFIRISAGEYAHTEKVILK